MRVELRIKDANQDRPVKINLGCGPIEGYDGVSELTKEDSQDQKQREAVTTSRENKSGERDSNEI